LVMALLVSLMVIFLLHAVHLVFRRLEDEQRSPRLEPVGEPPPERDSWPRVSIVVPARNEEGHLATCLSSLCALDYALLEIIVVNDRSTDQTGPIADRFASQDTRVKVIQGQETPPGWAGKNYAIHQGAQKAAGDYLLIVDADTTLESGTLTSAVTHMESENIDLLTLFPRVVIASFWEKALLPWLGVLSIFRMDRVNDPECEEAMAFGYFLFFRKSSFDKIGGYEAIRDLVGEDWIISQRIKGSGLRLCMMHGSDFVTKRFGPSLAEIWQGFTKNFILIMEGRKAVAALAVPMVTYFLLFIISPWVMLALLPGRLFLMGWDPLCFLVLLLATLQILVIDAARALLVFFSRSGASASWLQPLGGLVISFMGFTAIYRTHRGRGILWKGREYKKF